MNLLAKCLLLVCFMAVTGCNGDPDGIELSQEPYTVYSNLLELNQVAPREFISTGSVVSDQRIEISSRVSGYVRQLYVKEGDKVLAGHLLAQMDAANVEGAIRQAKAVVNAAQAEQKDAETDQQHYEKLYQRNSISESDLRKARLRADS